MKQVGDGGAKMVQRETKGECYYGCLLCVCVCYTAAGVMSAFTCTHLAGRHV